MANDPSGAAAGQESFAAAGVDTGFRHREGDAKTVSGPATVAEAGLDGGTLPVDVPGRRWPGGADVCFLVIE